MRKVEGLRIPDLPFGAAAAESIRSLLDQMMANLPGTLRGDDIEALHDMRVASRRLRAALRIFKPVFPWRIHRSVEATVKSVTISLGTVRDQDVFIEFLQKYQTDSNVDIGSLIEAEIVKREIAREEMIKSLGSLAGSDIEGQVEALLQRTSLTTFEIFDKSSVSFCSQALSLTYPRVRTLIAGSSAISDQKDIAALHAMRIDAKRLRYTLEPFAPYWGSPLKGKVSTVKGIQEDLGLIHDLDIWTDRLREHASAMADDRGTNIRNMISELEQRRSEEYVKFLKTWQEIIAGGQFDALLELLASTPE